MRHREAPPLLLALLAPLLALAVAHAADRPRLGARLPDFALRDPAGTQFTSAQLAPKGLVLVVTAPTMDNRDAQRDWSEALQDARPDGAPPPVFLEDMSASWFPGTALERMREKYRPGGDTLLLIDPEGRVREALNVEKGETVVLAFAPGGRLAFVETADPSPHRAQRLWRLAGAVR